MPDDDDTAAKAYRGLVADIMTNKPREGPYKPEVDEPLTIVNCRALDSIAALDTLDEPSRSQLVALWTCGMGSSLEDNFESDEMTVIEVADVVDATGTVRYRLFGWDFGCGWLVHADGLDVVGFASQHDIEHWHADQRPIFYAMDRALRAGGHGFRQPLEFCWWRDECWNEIADQPKGTLQSEPYVRGKLAEYAARQT